MSKRNPPPASDMLRQILAHIEEYAMAATHNANNLTLLSHMEDACAMKLMDGLIKFVDLVENIRAATAVAVAMSREAWREGWAEYEGKPDSLTGVAEWHGAVKDVCDLTRLPRWLELAEEVRDGKVRVPAWLPAETRRGMKDRKAAERKAKMAARKAKVPANA
jgi:hypothetical protein